ncbi:MAG: PD40 domain-containing protein [Armatimonadetes bacterium]|nr:PD40 domain-containing protein [Armatimonadota bacterium]
MSRERRSLAVFILIAFVLVVGFIWVANWLAAGGWTHSVARPGEIFFVSDRGSGPAVWSMNADGSGAKEVVGQPGEIRETAIAASGEWVFYTAQYAKDTNQLGRVRPDGRASGRLLSVQGPQSNISAGAGVIGYISNSHVFACGFDGKGLEKVLPSHADEAIQINEADVPSLRRYSNAVFAPETGWIAATSQGSGAKDDLFIGERAYLSLGDQTVTRTLLDVANAPMLVNECTYGWSPDGSTLAVASIGDQSPSFLAIYQPDPQQSEQGPIPFEAPARALISVSPKTDGFRNPAFTADAASIGFERIRLASDLTQTPEGIWLVAADGSGTLRQLVKGDAHRPLFSPDGKWMLYESGGDLWRYDMKTGKTLNLTRGQGSNSSATWSPVLKAARK